VAAGQHLPAGLLLHRLRAVRDALLGELGHYSELDWAGPAFWPAAIHLDELAGDGAPRR
jgi:hypothetical protein